MSVEEIEIDLCGPFSKGLKCKVKYGWNSTSRISGYSHYFHCVVPIIVLVCKISIGNVLFLCISQDIYL